MERVIKISAKDQQPNVADWYDTDCGKLYYFIDEDVWSCRDDRVSDEFPAWWLKADTSESGLHLQSVNRWAYIFDNWQPIMLGIAIALAFSVIVTMFENVIVKIALIIHGG